VNKLIYGAGLIGAAIIFEAGHAWAWTDTRGHWWEGPQFVAPGVYPRYEDPPAYSPPAPGGPIGPILPIPVPLPPPIVAPPPPQPVDPPVLGWIYWPYMHCQTPPTCTIITDAGGLNVRTVPNGPPTMALANGTPVIPVRPQGDANHPGKWVLVAQACNLVPTWLWSWNTGVTLMRCI
jgi:hypothetical protein